MAEKEKKDSARLAGKLLAGGFALAETDACLLELAELERG